MPSCSCGAVHEKWCESRGASVARADDGKDYKQIAIEMGKRVAWAMKFMSDPRGSSGMVALMSGPDFEKNGPTTVYWLDWFADAYEMLGPKLDRKALHGMRSPAKKKTRAAKEKR